MLKIAYFLKRLFSCAFIKIHVENGTRTMSLKSVNGNTGLIGLIGNLDIKLLIIVLLHFPGNLLIRTDIPGLLKQRVRAGII
ncbi:hypothetical protein D3C75_651860 [compost metagenome]